MRHVRMLAACLIAAFAIAAVAASGASALPEWGKCEAQVGGKYEDSNCQTKAKGKTGKHDYEWHKGATLKNVPFSGGNVGSGGVLSTTLSGCQGGASNQARVPLSKCEADGGEYFEGLAVSIECESENNTGEASGKNKVVNITVKFHGCKVFGAQPCSNTPNEGEIQVNPLKGELGYINKAEKKVGVLLEPAIKKGEFAKFSCAGFLSTVVGVGNTKEGAAYAPENHGGYDQIISPITPVNTTTSTYEQVYTMNPETFENIPNKFDGKHISLLESYEFPSEEPSNSSMWNPAGEEITNVNTATEPGEIKA